MISMYVIEPIHVKGITYNIGDQIAGSPGDPGLVQVLRRHLRPEALTAADIVRYRHEYNVKYGIEDADPVETAPVVEEPTEAVKASAKSPRRKVKASHKLDDGGFHVKLECDHETTAAPRLGVAPKTAVCPAC